MEQSKELPRLNKEIQRLGNELAQIDVEIQQVKDSMKKPVEAPRMDSLSQWVSQYVLSFASPSVCVWRLWRSGSSGAAVLVALLSFVRRRVGVCCGCAERIDADQPPNDDRYGKVVDANPVRTTTFKKSSKVYGGTKHYPAFKSKATTMKPGLCTK